LYRILALLAIKLILKSNQMTYQEFQFENNLTDDSIDTLKMLRSCEVYSINYKDTVYVKGVDVVSQGEVIDCLDSNKKISKLFKEYCKNM
jgi:hypothetical protein